MEKTEVRLTGPAKVGGVWKKPGDPVLADETTLAQLRQEGLLAEPVVFIGDPVELALRDVEDMSSVEAERDAALARAIEAEAQRDLLQDRVSELQDQLAAAQAAQPDKTQAETTLPTPSEPSPDPEDAGDTPAAPAPEKAAKPSRSRGGKKS